LQLLPALSLKPPDETLYAVALSLRPPSTRTRCRKTAARLLARRPSRLLARRLSRRGLHLCWRDVGWRPVLARLLAKRSLRRGPLLCLRDEGCRPVLARLLQRQGAPRLLLARCHVLARLLQRQGTARRVLARCPVLARLLAKLPVRSGARLLDKLPGQSGARLLAKLSGRLSAHLLHGPWTLLHPFLGRAFLGRAHSRICSTGHGRHSAVCRRMQQPVHNHSYQV
jgi:hypothetical protein